MTTHSRIETLLRPLRLARSRTSRPYGGRLPALALDRGGQRGRSRRCGALLMNRDAIETGRANFGRAATVRSS